MQELVDNRVIKRRSEMLRQLDGRLGREFQEQFVGEECEILLENREDRVIGRVETDAAR